MVGGSWFGGDPMPPGYNFGGGGEGGIGSLISGLYGAEQQRFNSGMSAPTTRAGTAPIRSEGFQQRPAAPETTRFPFAEQTADLSSYPWIDSPTPTLADFMPEDVHLTGSFPEGGQQHGVYSGAIGKAKKSMYAQFRGYAPDSGLIVGASDAQMERAMRQYFHGVGDDRRAYEDVLAPFLKEEMLGDWSRQQGEAKYQNELRYSQLLNLQKAQGESLMGQLENVGRQTEVELRRQSELLGGQALAGAYGTTNFGARAGQLRQIQQGLGEATRDAYAQQSQLRLGIEKGVMDQYMKIVEGRTDTYPSLESMASLMFNYGKSGVTQQQPQVQQAGGSNIFAGGIGGIIGAIFSSIFG
jgi:hypothetical protein